MSNFQDKIKEMLLLTDEDVPLLLDGEFKQLYSQNKDAMLRVAIMYSAGVLGLLLFLSIFSFLGAFGKAVFSLLLFSMFGFAANKLGKPFLLKATEFKAVSYFFILFFAIMTYSMMSGISSQGGFFSKTLLFLIIVGFVAGIYIGRPKIAELGINTMQMILLCLAFSSLLLSLQMSMVQFSVDNDIAMAQQRSEIRRLREAKKMQDGQASSKVCTSDEECRKMNTKKNAYYEQHEDTAQEICERSVAKEIPGRFEWTVSANEYKFTSYEVDVLKDTILLMGDKARLIQRNNEKTDVAYTCLYNTKTKAARSKVVKK